MQYADTVKEIGKIAVQAGEEILKIYHDSDFSQVVNFKSDNSPLTLADKAAHNIINEMLIKQFPEIPIISEEGREVLFEERKDWSMFWLVDPLDGTKEFINRNGEFTVNIALIKNNRPVLGVVYTPDKDILYRGIVGEGAKRITNGESKDLVVQH